MSVSSPRRSHFPRLGGTRRRAASTLLLGGWLTFAFCSLIEGSAHRPVAGPASADSLAQSALGTVLGSLTQEIAQGSGATTVGTAPNQSTVYTPLAPANAVPVRYPAPAPGDPAPNLLRRSVRADAIPAPGVPSLASAVNSAADPALDGSAVSPARWNLHYLLPRFDADGHATAPDAAAGFTAPDWVLVSRGGPAVQTGIGTGATALNNPDPANGNYVVGRYAFAMYDEGGLLDVNAAGYPTPAAPASPSGFTQTQAGYKGFLALADLTQLPIAKNPASPADRLSQASVDRLVGWRNYATARPGGAFPNYTFDAAASARYYQAVQANRTGFLAADPSAQFNGQTDQRFASRQQLIGLSDSLGLSRNALQYLTTFSRALEQPSFVPAHIQYGSAAPSINAVASTAPPAATAVDSYLGNNDAAGYKSGTIAGQDLINPSLLTIRVATAFNRFDLNQTPAVIGEPLLKRKFPLSRLAEVNYTATDSTASVTDPNFTANPSNPSAKNHIKDWFGLSRTSASAPWTYSHGGVSANGNGIGIRTLSQVAAAGREPDFAELLKASLNAGSMAKGGPNLHNDQGNYQYTVDTALDYQVLQIMANLIDQSDADSYPTVIRIAVGTGVYRTLRGVEDLPYFYRYHSMNVVTQLPSPLLSKSNTVAFNTPNYPSLLVTLTNCRPLAAGSLVTPGKVVGLYVPEVWNPHDANTSTPTMGGRPARFRLSVITDDPATPPATPAWQTGIKPTTNTSWYDDIPPKASIPAATAALVDASTAFTFSDDGGKLFREPTLLWRNDAPTNINLTPEAGSLAGPYVDANTNVTYYGVQIGQGAISYTGKVDHTKYPASPQASDDQYLFQASFASPNFLQPVNSYVQYTYRLQYQDPTSGNWITYDEKYPDAHGLLATNIIANKADYPNNLWANPYASGQLGQSDTAYDPRAARFGVGVENAVNNSGAPFLEPAAATNYNGGSSAANAAFGASKFTIFVTERPDSDRGNYVLYSLPGGTTDPGKNAQMRWFSGVGYNASNGQSTSPLFYDGLLAQNNPAISILARDNTTSSHLYYEDADGLARRAMGAYAITDLPASNTAAASTNLEGLPLATADTYAPGSFGVGTPTAQSQSRPLLLNRPFHSVAEMGCAFTGTPWKQLDFFTPESGDTALLDVFCLNEPPANALVGGKVSLNTHQAPVLQAILAGAYRDEISNRPGAPAYALPPLNASEAANAAARLVAFTTDPTAAWRGPLVNVADLVGRFVPSPGSTAGATDLYQYLEPVTGQSYAYAGPSAALDAAVYTAAPAASARIQRMREAAVRPLADCGQTRVWNILIDLVAQEGSYPAGATDLTQFAVSQESHCWLHVALDRATGQVLAQSLEPVVEHLTGLALSNTAVAENQPAGTAVGAILPADANFNDALTYSLVPGAGGDDNAAFAVSGGTLVTAGTFQYLARPSYSVRLRAAGTGGQSFEQGFTIAVLPAPYTQWKVAHFGGSASDPAIAGDLADPDADGLANLVEYALGTSPTGANAPGVTASLSGGTLTLSYTRASAATDVTAHAYLSRNLADPSAWTRAGLTETMLSDDGTVQQWQATVPVSAGQLAFLRLQVTRP